jgi:hypothetical protein
LPATPLPEAPALVKRAALGKATQLVGWAWQPLHAKLGGLLFASLIFEYFTACLFCLGLDLGGLVWMQAEPALHDAECMHHDQIMCGSCAGWQHVALAADRILVVLLCMQVACAAPFADAVACDTCTV